MRLKLNDSNLIVSYVQIMLRDFLGLSIRSSEFVRSTSTFETNYEVTASYPVEVTGVYNEETYSAASLYMAINYPYEGFPVRYDSLGNGQFIKTYFDLDLIKNTVKWISSWYSKVLNKETYENQTVPDYEVMDWDTFNLYFSDIRSTRELFDNKSGISGFIKSAVLSFVSNNIDNSTESEVFTELPERVLSYFFGEVVTPQSSRDEIYRIQRKLYDDLPRGLYGKFTDLGDENEKFPVSLAGKIRKIQKEFIDIHQIVSDGIVKSQMPDGFEDFKVTGYVDPWTELIIDGGV